MSELFPAPYHYTLGALFVSTIVPGCLWGAVCVQAFFYYSAFPKDSLPLKLFVGLLLAVDTVHQILIFRNLYICTVLLYSNVPGLTSVLSYKSLWEGLPIHGIAIVMVQSFYLYRIWRISGRNYGLSIAIGLLVLGDFVMFLLASGYFIGYSNFPEQIEMRPKIFPPLVVFTAVADFAIALTLSFYLLKGRTGLPDMTRLASRLMAYTLSTGIVTSLLMWATLIALYTAPDTFVYQVFFNTGGRLYVNSLVLSLNLRRSLRTGVPHSESKDPESAIDSSRFGRKVKLPPITFSLKQGDVRAPTMSQYTMSSDQTAMEGHGQTSPSLGQVSPSRDERSISNVPTVARTESGCPVLKLEPRAL